MRLKLFTVLPIVLIFILQASAFAKITNGPRRMGATNSIGSLAKSTKNHLNPAKTILSINNITSWVERNGAFPDDYPGGWNGSHPKGTVGVIFAEGIVWGAKVSGDGDDVNPRVNGSTYANGLSSGKVLGWSVDSNTGAYTAPTGIAVNDDQQIWRVRADYLTADLKSDAQSFLQVPIGDITEDDVQEIFETYDYAWNNWPAADGAPYDDVDGNGSYDPAVDIPGFPGASQTIWLVANDLDQLISTSLYGSPSIGLEMQMTLWGYDFASTSPLGNITYKRVRIIYTGKLGGSADAHIDTMYLSQWSDPDLGFFTDDYVGTDVEKSLGYVYNGTAKDPIYFGDFGLVVPAAGYDFLQGPIVDGDTLPMSSFTFFGAGSDISDPDLGVYEGTLQWFNLMEGFLPRPAYPIQLPLLDPITGEETKFWLSGDPVTGLGWIDGIILPPGDRRLIMTTGPFEMALGDTQDLVLALMGGTGKDNISSITVMKFHDDFAQFAFDNNFDLPSPPIGPIASAVGFALENSNQGRVTLTWNLDESDRANSEDVVSKGFAFEGYNVYQLPNATSTLSEGVRVATYDVVNLVQTIFDPGVDAESGFIVQQPKQSGSNSGLQRFFSTTEDAVRGRPLSTGIEYFFAVTAYSFLADNVGVPFKTLESSPVVLSVRPQAAVPGTEYGSTFGDKITVSHVGTSTARLDVSVLNPGKLETADYSVFWKYFNPATGDQLDALGAGDTLADGSPFPVAWNLTKDGTEALRNQTLEFIEGAISSDAPVIDGAFQLKVFNPPATALQSWGVPVGERWVSGTNWGGAGLFGGLDLAHNFFGSDLPEAEITPVQLFFQDQASVDANGYVGKGAVYRRDLGYPYAGVGELPLSAFDVSDPDNPRRLNISFVENEDLENGFPEANSLWDMGWFGAATDKADMEIATLGGREYLFIHGTDYQDDGLYYGTADGRDGTFNDGMWAIWPASRGRPYLLAEFTLEIFPSIKATVLSDNGGDVFSFTTKAPTVGDNTKAQADVEKINVFPNPYFGVHENETSRFDKFVTFNHLPEVATIRIFSLGGEMAKVIQKTGESQFLRWDLTNQGGFPVASGIYIVHIDMPELGKTKILKLALVQEEQILRTY